MRRITIEKKVNSLQIKISILVVITLFVFSSSLLATSSNQIKQGTNPDNLFYPESKVLNNYRSINGTDIIFESSFEPVPVLSVSANPTNINSGGLSIISWNLAENATSCTKSGAWSGSLTGNDVSNGPHNEVVENINVSSTYSLQCSNSFGNSPIRSVDVFVDVKAAPIVNLTSTANGTTSATLNWTLQNDAVFCQKSGSWSGLIQGNPTIANTSFNEVVAINGTYSLECSNSFGSNSDSTTVSNIINMVPPVLTLSASPTTVNSGGSSVLTWVIGNSPAQCIKSGDWPVPGNMSNAEITNGVHNLNISNITSNKSFSLVCVNAAGSSGTKTATVSVVGSGNVPTLTLSANPTTVNSGGSTILTWNIGNTPTQCIKTGDWSSNGNMTAQEITNGSHSMQINNLTFNRSYSLVCTNNAGSSGIKTVTVSIAGTGGNTWSSCSGPSAAILNGNEDRSVLANGPGGPPTEYNGFYQELFGTGQTVDWPGIIGATIGINIEKDHYVAAKFTTSNESIDARFLSIAPSNTQGIPPTAYTISISECPGDFNVHINQSACKSNFDSLRWSTTPNPPGPDGFFCELEKNKTYYLNIVHSNNSENNNYQTSDCLSQGNSCGHLSAQVLVDIR